MPKSILLDFTKCIGCQACERACAEQNNLTQNPPRDRLNYQNYTVVLKRDNQYFRKMCMHCQRPVCVSVCPVAAMEKTPEGPVIYHPDKCFGCRYCMMACPFQVPKYEWDKTIPVVRKCIMCYTRIVKEGEETACAWACPTGATRFGERDKLLAIAKRRIKNFPDKYVEYIYGENDVGGTSVMMLSGIPFTEMGFRTDMGTTPLPELTWNVMSKIPNIVMTGGLLLGGLSWIVNRRISLQEEFPHEKPESEKKGDHKK